MNHDHWRAVLTDRFTSSFPAEPRAWRTVGREAEFPVVAEDGTAADAQAILRRLAADHPDLTADVQDDLLVIVEGDGCAFAAEVGRGTIEVITGPQPDLLILEEDHQRALSRLHAAAAACHARVLGFGIQPVTPATPDLMSPKPRYGELLTALGPSWLWFTLTASDQLHVDISRDELIPSTNLVNALAPIIVGLCANSGVHGGADPGVCCGREGGMGEIHAAHGRHGMPRTPYRDVSDMIDRLLAMPRLLRFEGGRKVAAEGAFTRALDDARDPSTLWTEFLLHEHYVWNTGRPRTAHGTLEIRAACQQPLTESAAAAALGLGLVCAAEPLSALLTQTLGDDAWARLRAWHSDIVTHGLAAEEPVTGLTDTVLGACADALDARGRGETSLLDPLRARLDSRSNPAQNARAIFRSEGMDGLLAHLARRP